MRKFLAVFFFFSGISLFAGDVAAFINLGFSKDSHYYMFAQKGVDVGLNQSYAEAFIIDVEQNNWAKGGVLKTSENSLPELGAEATGLVFNLVRENAWLIKKYGIDHNNTGRVVYFLSEGTEPKAKLDFRVFDKNSKVQMIDCSLNQKVDLNSKKSAFFIDLKWKDKKGIEFSQKVGNENFWREKTGNYFIKSIVQSKESRCLIFVVGKEIFDKNDVSIRYMVECVNLK